ncbi:hypothetical protein ACGFYY_36640 [Streptomyces sp. NPDC048331]|uniref:hypothetical protein n=1 Tax=Streptomyces sp. NPDC048331 TaxID=3365534 RepID=UPI0037191246
MGEALFQFVYRTLHKRVNNPKSPYFLPKVLLAAKRDDRAPLLPVRADTWELGNIEKDPGRKLATLVYDSWWTVVNGIATDKQLEILGTCTPTQLIDNPDPRLTVRNAQVAGLENASLGDFLDLRCTPEGYSCVLPITLGAHDAPGLPKNVTLSGDYELIQHVAAADNPEDPSTRRPYPTTRKQVGELKGISWPVERVCLQGRFEMQVLPGVEFRAHARVQVAGQGTARRPHVVIERITLPKPPEFKLDRKTFTVTVTNKALKSQAEPWKDSTCDLFSSRQAMEEFADSFTRALNSASNLVGLNTTLSAQLLNALDGVLGSSPPAPSTGGKPESTVDRYLLDRARSSLGDAKSWFYPPSAVYSVHEPPLQPFAMDEVNLGMHEIEGAQPTGIILRKGTVDGIANLLIPAEDITLIEPGLSLSLLLGRIDGEPTVRMREKDGGIGQRTVPKPPLRLTADVHLYWEGDPAGPEPDAGLVVTVSRAAAALVMSFAGRDSDTLDIHLGKVDIAVANEDISAQLVNGGKWTKLINPVMNRDKVKELVLGVVKERVGKERANLSRGLTQAARQAIAAQLT